MIKEHRRSIFYIDTTQTKLIEYKLISGKKYIQQFQDYILDYFVDDTNRIIIYANNSIRVNWDGYVFQVNYGNHKPCYTPSIKKFSFLKTKDGVYLAINNHNINIYNSKGNVVKEIPSTWFDVSLDGTRLIFCHYDAVLHLDKLSVPKVNNQV